MISIATRTSYCSSKKLKLSIFETKFANVTQWQSKLVSYLLRNILLSKFHKFKLKKIRATTMSHYGRWHEQNRIRGHLQWARRRHAPVQQSPRSISKAQRTQNSLTVPHITVAWIIFPYCCATIFNYFSIELRHQRSQLFRRFPAVCCKQN